MFNVIRNDIRLDIRRVCNTFNSLDKGPLANIETPGMAQLRDFASRIHLSDFFSGPGMEWDWEIHLTYRSMNNLYANTRPWVESADHSLPHFTEGAEAVETGRRLVAGLSRSLTAAISIVRGAPSNNKTVQGMTLRAEAPIFQPSIRRLSPAICDFVACDYLPTRAIWPANEDAENQALQKAQEQEEMYQEMVMGPVRQGLEESLRDAEEERRGRS